MFLAKNIRYFRKKRHISQEELAKEFGYKSFTTIQKWEMGTAQPSLAVISKLADLFQVDLDDFTKIDFAGGDTPQPKEAGVRIPVLGKVAAGVPIEAVENIIDYEEIPAEWVVDEEYFGLQLRGDSMEPRMQEGDVVIVRKQDNIDSGDTAIVLINGSDTTCKKIKKTDGGILICPINPKYEPMFYSNEEIKNLPVTIIGKVVELRAKF